MLKKLFFIILSINAFCFSAKSQDEMLKAQSLYSSNFTIDGITRTFTFYTPAEYGKKDQYPLVIFLHAAGETGKTLIKTYGDLVNTKADSTGCVIVYADAVAEKWNTSHADKDSINDIGFFSILIDYFVQRYQCDAQQVYITGFGNGADMALSLACALPGKVKAIAPFFSTSSQVCNIPATISVMNTKEIAPQTNKDTIIAAVWNFFMMAANKQ